MHPTRRRWWPAIKAVLSVVILVFIARRFARDLSAPELYTTPIAFGWLVPSGLLYLAGLGAACLFWGWLLARVGPRPEPVALARAYYVGQLGKYVPGKALALVMRAAMARRAGVAPGLAGLTAFYEVLTTMASGVLLATAFHLVAFLGALAMNLRLGRRNDDLFGAEAWERWSGVTRGEWPDYGLSPLPPLLISLGLLVAVLVPILPPVFNRLADRLSMPFRDPAVPLPRLRWSHLVTGLTFAAGGWVLMTLALACSLRCVTVQITPLDIDSLVLLPALTVSYVAGFVVLVAPGGLGVRELCLTWLLVPEVIHRGVPRDLAAGKVILALLLARLAWTASEVLLAGTLFWTKER